MARMTSNAISREGRSGSAKAWGVSPEARQRMIDEAAYYRYVHRGFSPGRDLDDWLAAEADFERTSLRRQPTEAATDQEFGLQQSCTHGTREDEALKLRIRQYPRRDIPRIESIDPEDAPLKE